MATFVMDCIIFELQSAGGISVYWVELLKRLKIKSESTVLYCRNNNNIFYNRLSYCFNNEVYPFFIPRRYLSFKKNGIKKLNNKYIFHSSYFRYSNDLNAINITTVHDFTYEYFSSGLKKIVHSLQKKKAVVKSAGIICVSENTKRDLLRFYPWVDPSSVRVIYNGVGDEFFPVENPKDSLEIFLKQDFDKPFLLFVGDRSHYKNFDIFIELADFFNDYDLVVVGGGSFNKNEKINLRNIYSRVKHFQGISSEILNYLYNSAFCLVYPSSYEGFGIPILEAMKAGCPVVSTNFSSIPEVAGSAALLVDKVTVEVFYEKINQLFDDDFRNQIIKKGFTQADKFSWDKCFEETYAFYQEFLEKDSYK